MYLSQNEFYHVQLGWQKKSYMPISASKTHNKLDLDN